MNCEAYIAFRQDGTTEFYPRNIDPDTVSSLCAEVVRDNPKYRSECLVIRRSGDMFYHAFVRAIDGEPNSYICLLIGLNSVIVSNLPDLYNFFIREMGTLCADCHLTRYISSDDNGFYRDVDKAYRLLRSDFNSRYENITDTPGPVDYTRQPVTERLHIKANGSMVWLSKDGDDTDSRGVRKAIESGDTLVITSEYSEIQDRTQADAPHEASKPATPKKKKWLKPVVLIASLILALWAGYSYLNSSPDVDPYTTNPEQQILESSGLEHGNSIIHYYAGHFAYQGTNYPVMIAFIETEGRISKVIYKNVEYGGRIPMSYWSDGQWVKLRGKDGPNDFDIDLKTDATGLSGLTTDGGKTMDVSLLPTLESFDIEGI